MKRSASSAFVGHMTAEPEDAFEKYAAHCLRPDKIYYLRQKFPLSDFKSTSEWAQAVINEINLVLLPATVIDLKEMADVCRVVSVRCNSVKRSL